MNFDVESIGNMVIGMVLTASADTINAKVDEAAAKVVASVKDSNTQIDNTVALAAAGALERFASGIKTGLSEA